MKLLLLDRDGVINHDSDQYIKSPAEWKPIKGSIEAIARLTQAGWRIVIVTNQSGIARGLFDTSMLNSIHDAMHKSVLQAGGRIEAIFFCPHAADANCDCRKPKPGMLEEIERRLNVSLVGVPFVGDSLKDLQAAAAARARPVLVLTGKGRKTRADPSLPEGTEVYPDLAAFAAQLIEQRAEQRAEQRTDQRAS
jgi:D-glycero-D-manno-heptose 1,7-bisphosphate phosphatase